MPNTRPSTPFGKLFFKLGIWHPKAEDAIKAMYDKLTDAEKLLVEKATGIMAIVNKMATNTPDEVYEAIHTKFPDVTRENVQGWINKVLAIVGLVNEASDFSLEAALQKLSTWLNGFEGNEWIVKVQYVVHSLVMVIEPSDEPIQKLIAVAEYVYQNLVKSWLDKLLQSIFNK